MAVQHSKMKDKRVIGVIEKVTVYVRDRDITALARIDTGAHSNSIDLKLAEKLRTGPPQKTTVVKSASGSSVRPVLMLDIKIAGKKLRGRFTVADRAHLKYPLLIGRNILKNGFLIDPSKKI